MADYNSEQFNQTQQPQQFPSTQGYEGLHIEKPASVTVFGVLNCVFGGIGVLCTPFSMIFIMIPNQAMAMEIAPPYKIFLLISSIAGICFSAWLLSLGIGLLKFRGWARRGSIIYACIAIVWGIAGIILTVLAMSMGWMGPAQGGAPGAIGSMVGGFCGGIVGLIYPILLLIFMQSAKVKQAFAAVGG